MGLLKDLRDRIRSGEDQETGTGSLRGKDSGARTISVPTKPSEMIAKSKADKAGLYEFWELTKRFVAGAQWPEDTEVKKIGSSVKLKLPSKTRITVNLILNYYRNILARLGLAYPSITMMPASPSSEDIIKAKMSETAIRYFWWEGDVRRHLMEAIEYLLVWGTAAVHEYYDPDSESVELEVISPYDLFFEPEISKIDDSQWIAIRSYHTKEALLATYNSEEQVKQIEDATEAQPTSEGSEPSQPEGRLELYTIYWKDGRMAHVLGDEYLYTAASWPTKRMPIQVMRYTKIPGYVWGMAMTAPLVPLQYWYNRTRSKIIENAELVGSPKTLIPDTCNIPDGAFNDKPGEKIKYRPIGGAPSYMQAPPMPAYIIDGLTRFQAEMGDTAGIHSTSLGRRAVGIESGKAIDALAERDMSQLQTTLMDIEDGVREMAKVVLLMMKRYYTEPKWMRMLDNTGRVIFEQIQSTMLVDDPELHIQAGSLFRNEAQDRDAKVLQLFEQGLIQPDQVLEVLSFHTDNSHVLERVQNMAHAQDLLNAAKDGFDIEILASDDIEAFKRVWGEYMRTEEFYDLDSETQDYITDIVISLNTWGMPPEAYAQESMQRSVWPRQFLPNTPQTMQAGAVSMQQSPGAQEQQAGEMLSNAERAGNMEYATSRQQQRQEALISPVRGQGGF